MRRKKKDNTEREPQEGPEEGPDFRQRPAGPHRERQARRGQGRGLREEQGWGRRDGHHPEQGGVEEDSYDFFKINENDQNNLTRPNRR